MTLAADWDAAETNAEIEAAFLVGQPRGRSTTVPLWAFAGNEHPLPPAVRGALARPTTDAVVSAATAWEIEIKRSLGELSAPDDLAEALAAGGYRPLPVSIDHALTAGWLPPHHRDPFVGCCWPKPWPTASPS